MNERILHLIRHDDFQLPGSITTWAAARGWRVREIRFFEMQAPQVMGKSDLLVIMGGVMSANDDARFPWLPLEKRWISERIASGARVLGICLGAQILANILGGRVYRSPHREIGWFPVARIDGVDGGPFADAIPEAHESFLWHSETFDLPPGAVRLARSEGCANQAFAWGKHVLAVQFHPEMVAEGARAIVAESGHEIIPGPFVQPAAEFLAGPERYHALARVMHALLDRVAREHP